MRALGQGFGCRNIQRLAVLDLNYSLKSRNWPRIVINRQVVKPLATITMGKLWADTPLPLISETGIQQRPNIPSDHSAISCARNMAALHNLIIRCYNSSYNQCLAVRPGTGDASDFLQYNQVLYEHIKDHHDTEEDVLFPLLQEFTGEKSIMDQNIEEHHQLDEGLHKLRSFAFDTDPSEYDGEKLRSILDVLGPPLKKHLQGEISTFLDLAKYDSDGLGKLWAELSSKAGEDSDKFRVAVMMIGAGDNTFHLDGKPHLYPEYPFFVPYLAKYILSIRYAGAWRFNPSDYFGNPRPLSLPNPSRDDNQQ